MTRVKRGNVARKRRNKILQINKGFRGANSTLFRTANQRNMRSLKYAYRDRKRKKREFRKLWITRINAAAREQGLTYSQLIHELKLKNVEINRKVLSQIALFDQDAFSTLIHST